MRLLSLLVSKNILFVSEKGSYVIIKSNFRIFTGQVYVGLYSQPSFNCYSKGKKIGEQQPDAHFRHRNAENQRNRIEQNKSNQNNYTYKKHYIYHNRRIIYVELTNQIMDITFYKMGVKA